jgi:RND family efflux transporter MFP subunit
MFIVKLVARVTITGVMVVLACLLAVALWNVYMVSPWTRDGRVRAYVVDVAPEVSGTVVQLLVHDNEFVHKGDALFAVDPSRYRLSVAQAAASLSGAEDTLRLRENDVRRRQGLTGVVSAEEQEQFRSQSAQAQSSVDSAQAMLDTAKLNLQRSVVFAPANGYITNLLLRVGDYASAGQARLALIDSDSFWVYGYFEETKLRGISVGAPAKVRLMGYKPLLDGHVASISRGVNDQNGMSNQQGLQDVNPVFTWVRLAQRIPVRVHIDRVPPGVILSAGMTASVSLGDQSIGAKGALTAWLESHL